MSETTLPGTQRRAELLGTEREPGLGPGWRRASQSLAEVVPPEEVDGIWLFPPVRREEREWGMAVVSRLSEEGRRRIYTASYMLVVRGRERGLGRVAVEEVGESPIAVVHEVIKGVRERAGEAEPPVEISPARWYRDSAAVPPADVGPEPCSEGRRQ
ncbi:MAG: hypothetical protein JSW71_14395 [Gemmatimonadota bacterium]|nr:MAG: hypothetical protein JSW71_14395 [Gemmatimonadota bacterium]